jgi:hypothetical protein
VLWELAVGHVLLCFSVNVERTGQDLPRALGIGGRRGDFFPLVLFCKFRALARTFHVLWELAVGEGIFSSCEHGSCFELAIGEGIFFLL